ncbi:lytic murein transglycosylase [Halomonas halocynthiae]|uniref:lytic murein transglycosylase n=1 Tax=Halomonas halocynthiae TaxID=176290 RepID=UPI000413CF7B|nr:lytic murein transglycosylase [Halomonas halocynthiae]
MMPRCISLAVLCAALAGCQSVAAPVSQAVAADSAEPRASADLVASGQGATSKKTVAAPHRAAPGAAGFDDWLAEFRRYAAAEGISEATLARTLDGVRYRPQVVELDRKQPEFSRQIWDYLDSAVSASRVSNGRDKLATHRDAANRASAQYGVPPEVMVSIWGIESSYGGYLGDFSTLESLATLAHDGRRQEFASTELLGALRIIQAGDIAPEEMKGSWAGAMGHTQFIPSSFLAYAKDGDGDGRRDIWNSIPDVLASTANYLAEAGWRSDEPWGVEVILPQGFDYSLADASQRRSSQSWAQLGVTARDGSPLPNLQETAVIAPAGARGPAFLVGQNFRVILRYNNATSYALAVAVLSDRIAGRDGIRGEWPRELKALSRDQVKQMQHYLQARGFDVGTPDGIFGPNTSRGLREFQREQGLVPDGFATLDLLQRLQ